MCNTVAHRSCSYNCYVFHAFYLIFNVFKMNLLFGSVKLQIINNEHGNPKRLCALLKSYGGRRVIVDRIRERFQFV